MREIRRSVLAALTVIAASSARAQDSPPPIALPKTHGEITVDGDLSDPGWKDAAVIDTFYETVPADNTPPNVKTIVRLTYDDKYFYVGIDCKDPDPSKIRAPFVDRDNVIGTDDNFAIFLDTRNDHRSGMEFRVNPRGIQGDAVYNDANGNEDFSPDFYYDSAAKINADGWTAEMRIPFSSLRFPKKDPQTWGIFLWRNYPRDNRYFIQSSRVPRGSNCWLCHETRLTGITGLPSGGNLTVAPYFTAKESGTPRDGAGSDILNRPIRGNGGFDVKWTPNANNAVDATLNPDFSQVESDIGQIGVNNRFALFFPEKRPFFLEGVDLFDTPIQAVYTRTITSPRWGIRDTGKLGSSSYTLLVSQDRGGGSVIIPGSSGSSFAPQDYGSVASIGRLRQDVGQSFAGLLLTDREIEGHGNGHNRVFGPDFQWRPSDQDTVEGQLLISDTKTPDLPELASDWDGRRFSSRAIHAAWYHSGTAWFLRTNFDDIGDGFRADNGFVPQVGYRRERQLVAYNFYPTGFLRRIQPLFNYNYVAKPDGKLVTRNSSFGVSYSGWHNLGGEFDYNYKDKTRIGDTVVETSNFSYFLTIDPNRRFSRIVLNGFLGQSPDFANARRGTGGEVNLQATLKPTDHLQLDFNGDRQWLDVTADSGRKGRLFTAQIERLKATYNFTARCFVRVIGQYLVVDQDPSLYSFDVPKRSGGFDGSALFSYKLNWQTVLFVGYGDSRVLNEQRDLLKNGRQFFLKISYAFQR
jgi:hypothetical protein